MPVSGRVCYTARSELTQKYTHDVLLTQNLVEGSAARPKLQNATLQL